MLGRGVKRRSEFETSDFSQNPVWAFCFILGKTETIRLSCLYLYVPGPAELFLLLSLCTCCSFCWECPSHDWLSFLRLTHQLSEKSSLTTVLKGQPSTPELLVRFLLYFHFGSRVNMNHNFPLCFHPRIFKLALFKMSELYPKT